jgi:large conductance mechanosensitive channel
MAIGIIIGPAFGKVVSSLVNDIIMPPLGFIIYKVNFKELNLVIQEASVDPSGNVIRELVAIHYGSFIQVIIDFLIITLSIFFVIRVFNRLRRKAENVQDETTPTPKEIELLSEIRDLLKVNNRSGRE